LYVGELDKSVTEAMLFEMFSVVGTVSSVRVCRDNITRQSLGYAYVNFAHPDDADRAFSLNYTPIKGTPCRIMWSQRDPSTRRSGDGNIFIKNLAKDIDNKALNDTFAQFGKIISCKVAYDDAHVSKGYGFVHFETKEDAQKAIDMVNEKYMNGQQVFVGFFIPKNEREDIIKEKQSSFTNLYVKNFPKSWTEQDLHALFEQHGTITSLYLSRNEANESLGFAFINYDTHEQAAKAVANLHNTDQKEEEPMYVGRAQKKHERTNELKKQHEQLKEEQVQKYQGVNLYVKNLDDTINDDRLEQEFVPFGTITSAKVMKDANSRSKGFGFVCFATPDEATKAVTEMNGKIIGSKPLYVALAQRKDQRRNQLEQQYSQRAQMRLPTYGMMGMPPRGLYMMRPQQGQRPVRPQPHGQQIGNQPRPMRPRPNMIATPSGVFVPQPLDQIKLMPEQEAKKMLGNCIFGYIRPLEPKLVSKLTGMILNQPIGDVVELLQHEDKLKQRIEEGIQFLNEKENTK
jgi:polyadenylate-binding protein